MDTCDVCHQALLGSYLSLRSGEKFHYDCFRCQGCNNPINGSFTIDKTCSKTYYHPNCYETLFAPHCIVCGANLSGQQFQRHSYFSESGGYCKHHDGHVRSCFSCHRKEPREDHYLDLPDGRQLCYQCVASSIFESTDAKNIYLEVIDFMESHLGLVIPSGMRDVPVLAVDIGCLNDQQKVNAFGRHGGSGSICRGLTLSTTQKVLRYMVPQLPSWTGVGSNSTSGGSWFMPPGTDVREQYFNKQPGTMGTTKQVTAVLVLFGLPKNLTASILAHEAMHVWAKLSPLLMQCELPDLVEEGICQLIAFKYLEFLEAKALQSSVDGREKGTWEFKLIQYNKYSIEVDVTPVYGEGFRQASAAYAAIGLAELFHFISEHKTFPVI